MGEMADALIEEGMDGWLAHISGDCNYLDPCPYCEAEEEEEKENGS